MIWIDLLNNLSLLIALSVVSGFVNMLRDKNTFLGVVLQGVVFGSTAAIGMLNPFVLNTGLIFDGRSALISLGALFFGPWTAGIACLITIALRMSQGGPGTTMGILVILVSAVIGLCFRQRKKGQVDELSTLSLLKFGFAVHLAMLVMTLALPTTTVLPVLKRIALPVLLIYPLATVLIGKILCDQSVRFRFSRDLIKSADQHRAILRTSMDGYCRIDLHGRLQEVNPAYCRMSGYSENELLALYITNLDAHGTQDETATRIQQLIEQGYLRFESKHRRKDGSLFDVFLSAQSLPDDTAGIAIFIQDITERKQTERYNTLRLEILQILSEKYPLERKVEQILTVLKEQTGSCAVGLRLQNGDDFPYLAWNGFSSDFILKENTLILRDQQGYACRDSEGHICLACMCGLVLNGKTDPNSPFFTRGGSFWTNDSFALLEFPAGQNPQFSPPNACIHEGYAAVALIPLRDKNHIMGLLHICDQRKGVFARATIEILEGIASNIVEAIIRKRTDEELQKIEKLKSIGALAGGIAHDFNNILVGLYGNISLAKELLDRHDPAYQSLEEAEKSMSRAVQLTRQLLTFSKGGTPIKEDVCLGALIEEIARFDLSGSAIRLCYQDCGNVRTILADKGQIQQVISNLVINARQAMPNGGHLTITLENVDLAPNNMLGLQSGCYVKVTVQDTGPGIDPELLGKIFDPYFTTKTTGSGLGLTTVWSIIHKHDGHIQVESKKGQGTSFIIHLPASTTRGEVPAKIVADSAPQVAAPLARAQKILVLDDEPSICTLIAKILTHIGYSVETVSDGQQAVARYQQAFASEHPFDGVIMDLTIPGGKGGKEIIKELLFIDPQIRAIASSGYAEDPVMADPSAYGFKGTVAKPYSATTLREAVQRMFA